MEPSYAILAWVSCEVVYWGLEYQVCYDCTNLLTIGILIALIQNFRFCLLCTFLQISRQYLRAVLSIVLSLSTIVWLLLRTAFRASISLSFLLPWSSICWRSVLPDAGCWSNDLPKFWIACPLRTPKITSGSSSESLLRMADSRNSASLGLPIKLSNCFTACKSRRKYC